MDGVSTSHVAVGLAILAVAGLVAVYIWGHYYFASRVNVAYLQSLWTPIATGSYIDGVEGRTVMASEADREILRCAWRETLHHGESLWMEWTVWTVIVLVLALLVLVGSLGAAIFRVMRMNGNGTR